MNPSLSVVPHIDDSSSSTVRLKKAMHPRPLEREIDTCEPWVIDSVVTTMAERHNQMLAPISHRISDISLLTRFYSVAVITSGSDRHHLVV